MDQENNTELWFYHLVHWSLERALPTLLEKTLERGWRAIIRCETEERVQALDAHLWTFKDDSYLPHGTGGDDNESRQPILLTTGMKNSNAANALFVVDGAPLGDIDAYTRCILLFDGNNHEAVAAAREEWKRCTEANYTISYWQQTERGNFEQKA